MTPDPKPLPEAIEKAIKSYHTATYTQMAQEKLVGPPAFLPVDEYAALATAIAHELALTHDVAITAACARIMSLRCCTGEKWDPSPIYENLASEIAKLKTTKETP